MRAFRLFLRDRSSAAAIAAVLVQLMLLQAVAAGQACLDVAFADGPQILCSGAPAPVDWRGADAPAGGGSGHCPDCACATLCGASGPLPATLGSDVAPVIFTDPDTAAQLRFESSRNFSRPLPRGELRQRGPPVLSA
ncbi:hypothetical protein [Jiella avicenniae]|uniref:DUF2946 domain-containing protein n=1 Tax=Jiella avicenniae TaxID=2907202 RepID=A0A9X1T3S7_9HYPH|nr:hypothetical protein [Jiella avicenniae]MCE7026590.1 hypothetical protein [Jiella avicenniae]